MRSTSRRRMPSPASPTGAPSPGGACEPICGLAELDALAMPGGPPLGLRPVAERVSLRIEDVARVTGLSKSLVRGLIRDGELPAVKVRTIPLVLVADLVAFLEARRTDPKAAVESIAAELETSLRREGR